MKTVAMIGLAALSTLAAPASAQVDMAAIQKWSKARSVHYHVEGRYDGWTAMSQKATGGEGHVTDSVTLDFDWKIRERTAVGAVKFSDGTSQVAGLRNSAQYCPAPVLSGRYEHITVASVAPDEAGRLLIKGTRDYPALSAPLECPASLKLMPLAAARAEVREYVAVPEPMLLAVGSMGKAGVEVAPDGKSFTIAAGQWRWTYTPSLLD